MNLSSVFCVWRDLVIPVRGKKTDAAWCISHTGDMEGPFRIKLTRTDQCFEADAFAACAATQPTDPGLYSIGAECFVALRNHPESVRGHGIFRNLMEARSHKARSVSAGV